jgi:Ca-activated chloride channel family protein
MKKKTLIILLVMLAVTAGRTPAQEKPLVRIVSPANDEIWFGKLPVRIDADNLADDSLYTLEIYLDGRLVREFRQPPYVFQHDFGKIPRNSILRAILRVNNQVVASAEIRSLAIDDAQEVDVTQVLVPVVVTDAHGNYISGLEKEDFVLLEDGKPQLINNFSKSGKTQFHLALLIDISSSMKDKIGGVKDAARQFLQKLLNPNDRAIIVFFNHEVFEDTDFSSDVNELSNSIATAFPFGATALYDAVGYCLKLFKGMSGLNIIIILSDGEDNSSYLDPFTLIKKAERSNAVIYAIGKRNSSYNDEYQTILNSLATSSGGMLFFIEDSSEIQRVYDTIRHDIKAEYVLEFSPSKSGRGKHYRKIAVTVKGKKKYVIRTIKGFYY